MEFALTESLLYLPPLIIAGLIALYRNNILCFWDCNPVGIATKQFTGQIAVKITWLLEKARSTALLIRNLSSDLVTLARNTQLMIVNTIAGILVTIKQSFDLLLITVQRALEIFWNSIFGVLVTVQETLLALYTFVVSSVANYTEGMQDKVVSLFQTTKTIPYPASYIYFLIVASSLCLGFIIYGFYKAMQEPIQQEEEMKEDAAIRKSPRLRTKKTN